MRNQNAMYISENNMGKNLNFTSPFWDANWPDQNIQNIQPLKPSDKNP